MKFSSESLGIAKLVLANLVAELAAKCDSHLSMNLTQDLADKRTKRI